LKTITQTIQTSAGNPGAVAKAVVIRKKIWIDLDNSPHVPFFAPIIDELERQGYSVILTARDCFQVCELADLYHIAYKRIGRHYGKSKLMKVAGTIFRAFQLLPVAFKEKPDLVVSHGSRSQLLTAAAIRIRSLVILDYEFARFLSGLSPTWVMAPEVIPSSAVQFDARRILKYPGIKEDVYVPGFKPDRSIVSDLHLNPNHVIVTVRPPANEAHYHNPESESLFRAVMDLLRDSPDTTAVLLPRNGKQGTAIQNSWPELFASGKVRIPDRAVDGLNLIWHSDLVISGGGTMNREAAALGIPVYSIFRGKIGAVDRYLADAGRLVLVESVAEVRSKIALHRRERPTVEAHYENTALAQVVTNILEAAEAKC
jgi:predicted glycosyltransferase